MRIKISTLRRAKFLLVALALVLTSAPFTPLSPSQKAFAAGNCAANRQELENLVSSTSTYETISLCPTSSNSITVSNNGLTIRRSLTLDLNGKTITGSVIVRDGATVILKNGTITGNLTAGSRSTAGTIKIESGTYNGNLSTSRGGGSFVITGGTFRNRPSNNYIPQGYSITTNGSGNNRTYTVAKDAEVSANNIVIPVGGAAELFTITPASASYTTTVTQAGTPTSNAVSISTTTTDDVTTGTATGLTAGTYNFNITATGNKVATSTITVYEATAPADDLVLFAGQDYDLDIDFANNTTVDYALQLNTRGPAVSLDGHTITALESGNAEIAVVFADSLNTTKTIAVHVYDFDSTPESLIVSTEGTATIRPESTRVATLDDGYDDTIVNVTNNNGEFEISGLAVGKTELTFSITPEDGATITKVVTVYVYKAPTEAWVAISGNTEIAIEKPSELSITSAVSTEPTLVGFEGANTTLIGYRSGNTTVTYTLAADGKTADTEVTVHIYKADIPDNHQITLMEGTSINLSDTAIGIFENSDVIRAELSEATSGEAPVTLTGTTVADGTITAGSVAGSSTVTFFAGEEEIGTVDFLVFTTPTVEDQLLSVSGRGASKNVTITIDAENIPAYTLTSSTGNVSVNGTTIEAENAGDDTITVTFEAYKNPTITFAVQVSNFTTSINNSYDMAEGSGEITFTASEAYDQSLVACTINGSDCENSDAFTITSDANGKYTVSVKAGADSGRYTLTLADSLIPRNNTVSTNIVVRKIEVSASEIYAKVGEIKTFAASISGGSRLDQLSASVIAAEGGRTNDVTVFCTNNSGCFVNARKAGQYTIELRNNSFAIFTPATTYATKTVTLYVTDFDVEDTEYHIVKDDTEPKLVKALNEYWNKTGKGTSENFKVTADSDTDYYFWPTNIEAGNDYELEFYAYAGEDMTVVRDTKTVTVHVYEMIAPEQTTYYAEAGDNINIEVKDKNSVAYTRAVVESGSTDGLSFNRRLNGNLRNYNVTARTAGTYTVRYTDYMGNGQPVGEFVATIIVIEAEEENNLIVAKGKTLEISGHSTWGADTATNLTTGDELTVTEDNNGTILFDTTDLEPGRYNIEASYTFEDGVSRVVKRANVIVYELVADSETDPEGITAETLEKYLKELVKTGQIDDLLTQNGGLVGPIIDMLRIAGMSYDSGARNLFGDSSFDSLYGLHSALNDGDSVSTRLVVRPFEEDEDVDEELADYIASLGYDIENLSFFDVSVVISNGAEDFGNLHELTREITFVLCEVSEPAEGYSREYIVIRQHNGASELVPSSKFFVKDGKLYVMASEFSTYAVTFEDTLIPAAPNTGNFTTSNSNVSENISVAVALTAIAILTVLTTAGIAMRRH